MTLEELGLRVIRQYQRIGVDYTDMEPGQVAEGYLQKFPHRRCLVNRYIDHYDNVVARSTHQEKDTGFWGASGQCDVLAERVAEENKLLAIKTIHAAEIAIEASARGLAVDVYSELCRAENQVRLEIVREEHRARIEVELERRRRDLGLDGAQRVQMQAFHHMAELQERLFALYEARDMLAEQPETPAQAAKLRLLDTHIQRLEAVFDARGEQEVVQTPNRRRLGFSDEDADGNRQRQSSPATDS